MIIPQQKKFLTVFLNFYVTMATCFANYDLSISHGVASTSAASQNPQRQQQTGQVLQPPLQQTSRLSSVAAAALVTVTAAAAASNLGVGSRNDINSQKDYSTPLHVDCSVEYELPNQPKPPAGQRVEPLLMIHPCYFRKMESQRRSPFINNMPTSRNSVALLVGVSQSLTDIVPSSATMASSRRLSVRQQQHSQVIQQAHLNQRQPSGSQYNAIQQHTNHQQQQIHPQNNSQQMSQMSQQAHYPVVSVSSSTLSSANGQYIEHASTIRRLPLAAASSVHRSHQQSRSAGVSSSQHQKLLHHHQHQSNNQHQNLLVQNSSSSLVNHWDQLAAVATIVTSIPPHNANVIPPSTNASSRSLCSVKCSSISSSVVGKRDAMISGGYAAATSLRNQSGRLSNNTNSSRKQNEVTSNGHSVSTSLVDTTNLRWSINTSLTTDRSPIATVPSNYQAGPDTTPTIIQTTRKTNDNNANMKNNITSNGKYRQYLRSHRTHPYLETPVQSSTVPSSIASVNYTAQGFPQFSAPTAAALTPSFQQHLQQISCYNV